MNEQFLQPTVIVIAGMPAHGKTTIAQAFAKETGIHHLDIDDTIRFPIFGPPVEGSTIAGINDRIIGASYELLMHAAAEALRLGRSVVITATFIRPQRQEVLRRFLEEYAANTKIFFCELRDNHDAEIADRLARRRESDGPQYVGGIDTQDKYDEVRAVAEPLPDDIPFTAIETSSIHSPEELVREMIDQLVAEGRMEVRVESAEPRLTIK
jgi:predicted kinase